PEWQVRLGIHSGPVKEVTDLREQGNIAGAGINIAQRVMDCGDAGHILLSKRVADDLEQYAKWRPLLHDLGSCEVKHGVSLALFNLYSNEFGNPERPKKFAQDQTFRTGLAAKVEIDQPAAPKKSIAVLPFENLSDDKNDTHLWAEKYDRQLTDIFAVESDIAANIADTLQAKLTGAERRAIAARPTQNTEAHDLYLKGKHHWRNFYAPGYERVCEYFEQAITLDASFAPAYTGLSLYYSWAAANALFRPDVWPRAE